MRVFEIVKPLTEAPLPDDWDAAIYSPNVSFKKRVEYAKSKAQKIGTGSSRIAFKIPYEGRDTVLKIAKNRKGMSQNEAEAQMLSDWYVDSLGLFIPMIDYDEDGLTWIHTEYAPQVKSDAQFESLTGFDMVKVIKYLQALERSSRGRGDRPKHSDYQLPDPEENEMLGSLVDFTSNHPGGEFLGDYNTPRNWGVYNGMPVIIDAGWDESTAKLYGR